MPNCNSAQRDAINGAFDTIHNPASGRIKKVKDLGGECVRLATLLESKTITSKTAVPPTGYGSPGPTSLWIDCIDCDPGVYEAYTSKAGTRISFCNDSLPPSGIPSSVEHLLFHELIHACGGRQIDAFALTYYVYFNFGPGTANKEEMCRDSVLLIEGIPPGIRRGEFVGWDPVYGSLFPLIRDRAGNYHALSPFISLYPSWVYHDPKCSIYP